MGNFWAQALNLPAAPAPAPPQPPYQQPAPIPQPWYAPPQYQQPAQPYQMQPAVPQGQPYPGHPQAPAPEQPGMWGTIEGSSRRAKSARLTQTCPECGSGNYFRPEGKPNALLRCQNCGYNERFTQSGGDGGLPGGDGQAVPATPARQTSAGGGGGSQFRPDVIIAHL